MSKDLVAVHNTLIRASYNLSVNEQRLILTALSQIPKSSKDELIKIDPSKGYYITRQDFIRLGSRSEVVLRDIRAAAKDLKSKDLIIMTPQGIKSIGWIASIDYFKKNADKELRESFETEEEYKSYIDLIERHQFYSYNDLEKDGIDPDDVVLKVFFDPRIVPFLSELQVNFTQFMLDDVAGFTSLYSIRIYQMMMQYKKTGHCEVGLNELRFALAIENKYPLIADLKRWVIDTALAEINEKSPYKASYEMARNGRKFSKLIIKFKEKKKRKPKGTTTLEKAWEINGLSDAQIGKLRVFSAEFCDANQHNMPSTFRGSYNDLIDFWVGKLKDPQQVKSFRMIDEILARPKP